MDDVLPLIHEAARPRLLSYIQQRMRGEAAPAQYEYRGARTDGTVFWLESQVQQINWCGEPAIQATVIDITRRKKKLNRRCCSPKLTFDADLKTVPIGVTFVDRNLHFIRVNRVFSGMTG